MRTPKTKRETIDSTAGVQEEDSDGGKLYCTHLYTFLIFATVNTVAAVVNHIDDTDETFGYWEPLHFLLTGRGMQTWEYAPEYALRTYAFIAPFALVAKVISSLGISKIYLFYTLRCVLGLFTALCEAEFVSSTRSAYRGYLLTLLLFSPGVFYFSTSYLPSAVGSSLLMLAIAMWRKNRYIFTIFIGCIAVFCTGWPFIGVLFLPLGIHMLFSRFKDDGLSSIFKLILAGIIVLVFTASVAALIDHYYYQKWTFPPLNILLYNALGGTGDELYGVESVTYYLKALLLNTALGAPLSFLTIVVLIVQLFTAVAEVSNHDITLTVMVLLWLGILFSRPHKEERFLYPVYPLLAYLASTAVSKHIASVSSRILGGRNFFRRKSIILVVFIVSGVLAVSRVFSNYNNYSGVIRSWTALYEKHQTLGGTGAESKICVGNEWYAFPSHFFLNDDVQLAFVQEEFHGVLPQYFNSFTWDIPTHPFNDRNKEEKSRYVEIGQCYYFVLTVEKGKSSLSSVSQDLRLQIVQTMPYQAVSKPVIQPSSSPALTRAFFVPYISSMKNVYAQYTVFSTSDSN